MNSVNISNTGIGCGCAACAAGIVTNNSMNPQNIENSGAHTAADGERLLATQWLTNSLKYNFPESRPSYYSRSDDEARNLQAFSQEMQDATVEILQQIENFTNLRFTETSNPNSYGTLTFTQASLPLNAGAWAYYPTTNLKGGDVWTNNNYASTQDMTLGNYGYFTLMHEIGHALGLRHSFEVFSGEQATSQYSVMAYDWSPYFSTSYQIFDIAALQSAYGANTTYRTGNDVYILTSQYAYTIWDAGGDDTFDASAQTINTTLDLREGGFSTVGVANNIAIAFGVTIENAKGGSGNDTITGNDADNTLEGNAGNDVFFASAGDDILNGGVGNDTVYYDADRENFIVSIIDAATFTLRSIADDFIDTFIDVEVFVLNDVIYNAIDNGDPDTLSLFDVRGTEGDDYITGYYGDETLLAFGGDDTLIGFGGDDLLEGGSGSDHYIYAAGHDFNTINDSSGANDAILFDASITQGVTRFNRQGNDLEITFTTNSDDKILVQNHYGDADNEIEHFIFRDNLVTSELDSYRLYTDSQGSNGAFNTSTEDALPILDGTTNITAEGIFSSSGSPYNSRPDWHAFDGENSDSAWSSNAANPWAAFEFNDAKIINKYMISSRPDWHNHAETAPKDWTFDASNDGVNWITLDTVSGETNWGRGEERYFDFINDTAFEHYRVSIQNNNGFIYTSIGEIDFIESTAPNGHVVFENFSLADVPAVEIKQAIVTLTDYQASIDKEVLEIYLPDGLSAQYSADSSNSAYVLNITGVGTIETYEAALQTLVYQNTDTDAEGTRNIKLELVNSFDEVMEVHADILLGTPSDAVTLSQESYVATTIGGAASFEPDGAFNTSTEDALPMLDGTTNITAEGIFSSSGSPYNSRPDWHAFDGENSDSAWSSNAANPWAAFEFNDAKIINKYMISSRPDWHNHAETAPKDWTFDASNDGVNWITLDTVSGETNWGRGEERYFDFVNDTAYEHYRVSIQNNNGFVYTSIGEIDFIEAPAASISSQNILDDIIISTPATSDISSAVIRVKAGDQDISDETLSVADQSGITSTYETQGDYFALTLSGDATAAEYQDVIRSVSYRNSANAIGGDKEIEVIVFDSNNNIDQSFVKTLTLVAQQIEGDAGDDIYEYRQGDGQIKIYDLGGDDALQFVSGFQQSDLVQTRVDDNLEITFTNSLDDKITIKDYYDGGDHRIENFNYGINFFNETSHSILGAGNATPNNIVINDSVEDALPILDGTTNITAEGIFSSSGSPYNSRPDWHAFDGENSDSAWSSNATNPWAAFEFNDAKIINKYMISSRPDWTNYEITAPKDWTFDASNDGVNWITLDTVSGETNWGRGEERYFNFANDTAFEHYRVSIQNNNGFVYTSIGEIDFIEAQDNAGGYKLFEGITLNDADGVSISSIELRLAGHEDGIDNEIISANVPTEISVSYTEDGGAGEYVFLVSGLSSVANYQNILDSLHYTNNALTQTDGLRQISVTVKDQAGNASDYDINIQIGTPSDAVTLSQNSYVATTIGGAASFEPDGAFNTSTEDALPILDGTTNITAEGIFSSSGTSYASRPDWRVFDGDNTESAWSSSAVNPWVAFEFNDAKIINKYMISSRPDWTNYEITAPKDWTFDASHDGVNWITLDTIGGETNWGRGEERYFDFVNDTAFEHYRVSIQNNNGFVYTSIGEIDFIEAPAASISSQNILDDITISTPATSEISSAVIRVRAEGQDISDETLSVIDQSGITSTYETQGDYFALTLSGNATAAEYQDVIRSVSYRNSANAIGGDKDIEVIVFDGNNNIDQSFVKILTLVAQQIEGSNSDEALTGGDGNDILYGNDGFDTLFGGEGADIFAIKTEGAFNDVDQILDFMTSEGDALDLSDLLSAYDSSTDNIEDFVQITDNGTDSFVAIDQDGTGGFTQVATLKNVTALDNETQLVSDGHLIL